MKILTRLFFLNISWANMDIFAYLVLTFLGFKVVHLVRRLFNSGAFKKMAEISAEVGGGFFPLGCANFVGRICVDSEKSSKGAVGVFLFP